MLAFFCIFALSVAPLDGLAYVLLFTEIAYIIILRSYLHSLVNNIATIVQA